MIDSRKFSIFSVMTARYSKGEEIANTSTHAVGILMGVVIGVIFIVMSVKGGDAWAE